MSAPVGIRLIKSPRATRRERLLSTLLRDPVRALGLILGATTAFFFAAHLLTQYVALVIRPQSSLFRIISQGLNLNQEANLPTWYSSALLLMCAFLFGGCAWFAWQDGSRHVRHWTGLSAVALACSADEVASLHEKLNDPVRTLLGVGGYLTFAWVVPGMICVLILAFSYRRFYNALPDGTRRRFGLAVSIYFFGSLILETIGGRWSESHGRDNFTYSLLTGFEELFEMSAIALLVTVLGAYLLSNRSATLHKATTARSEHSTDGPRVAQG